MTLPIAPSPESLDDRLAVLAAVGELSLTGEFALANESPWVSRRLFGLSQAAIAA
jgi:hypothetical protein